ncbi:MAG TPA: hypothetical protein VKF61_06730 [Candidatus Polarisedimenticolia bacterium]|nr:hypothetical protein [Candidatus Polarisedimenticolia bacterium]
MYGSYWDAGEADDSAGGGAKIDFPLAKVVELELRGTYYPNLVTDVIGQRIEVKATPLDGGLRVTFLPSGRVHLFAGAGLSFYLLTTDRGEIDNTSGIYGLVGLDFGNAASRFFVEAMWRKMDTEVTFMAIGRDVEFDGLAADAGVVWRWGR